MVEKIFCSCRPRGRTQVGLKRPDQRRFDVRRRNARDRAGRSGGNSPWFRCLKHREFGVSDTALKTRKDAEPEQWERALKKAIERAGAQERPKILDLDF